MRKPSVVELEQPSSFTPDQASAVIAEVRRLIRLGRIKVPEVAFGQITVAMTATGRGEVHFWFAPGDVAPPSAEV